MKWLRLLASLAVLAVALGPRDGNGCGPFLTDLEFTTYHGPTPAELAAGQIGVLRPHFYREPLLLAYRTLSGAPLTPEEKPGLEHWPWLRETAGTAPAASPVERWLAARKKVAGAAAVDRIDTDRLIPGSEYQNFTNCLDGAFENATATLGRRIAQWGAADPRTAEWLKGQDQVFENCSAGPKIPPPLPAADRQAAADREYQVAAAAFYALQLDQARAAFDKIAADGASPWHDIAPYLAARASIRQGTFQKDESSLRDAVTRLRAIVKDPARSKLHDSAEGLLEFVRARLEPGKRLVELGAELMKPLPADRFSRALTDYTTIWDRMEEAKQAPPAAESDLADWIVTVQKNGDGLAKWREVHSLAWLVAAVMGSDPRKPMPADLAAAARAVKSDSPAYPTVSYYGIRGLILQGKADDARQWTDQALAAKPSDAFANLLRAERLSIARDWTEFLRFAPRRPVAEGSDDLGTEEPLAGARTGKKAIALDSDSVRPLNREVPLKLWIDAARSDALSRTLQADIARAGWVRSVILGDTAAARTLAARVSELSPDLAPEMRAYLAEKEPGAALFTAAFLMLRAPGLEPVMRPGEGRTTPALKQDIFRDNWWDLDKQAAGREPVHDALNDLYPKDKPGPARFLPKEQRAAGEKEWTSLGDAASNGVEWLCGQAIAWAQSHPQDARVPQALHLAVDATHYGPAGDLTHKLSKQAFDILHRGYPASEWARKTKYWY